MNIRICKEFTLIWMALVMASCLVITDKLQAQPRALNKTNMQKYHVWYDTTTAGFQVVYPALVTVPPISLTMPPDVIDAYTVIDSVLRYDSTDEALGRIQNWDILNDTLSGIAKYLYIVMDYNPIIFRQYIGEVALRRAHYPGSLSAFVDVVLNSFSYTVEPIEDRIALASLLRSDYILRVVITSIDSMYNKRSHPSTTNYIYEVTANIIEVLKGQVRPECVPVEIGKRITEADTCIRFQFIENNYFQGDVSDLPYRYKYKDLAFSDSSEGGRFRMHVGQEAIVFLTHKNRLVDSSYDYFDLSVEPLASYNALPIIGGYVRDVNSIWSPTLMLPYATWHIRFNDLRNRIVTGSYY